MQLKVVVTPDLQGVKNVKRDKGKASKQELDHPVRLADLIEYHAGSVVSRTIIDRQTGTVTLFSFDKDEGLSEHTAPFDALVFVVDGEAEVTLAGKSSIVKTGEMIVMPAHKSHALRAIERFKMLLIMIRS
jgi:quercetin dioxygenase-like cupin family protein